MKPERNGREMTGVYDEALTPEMGRSAGFFNATVIIYGRSRWFWKLLLCSDSVDFKTVWSHIVLQLARKQPSGSRTLHLDRPAFSQPLPYYVTKNVWNNNATFTKLNTHLSTATHPKCDGNRWSA